VSKQGSRAVVGDQSSRGARLNPVRRLTLAGAGVIAGAAVVAIGSRLAWATVTIRPSTVTAPGLPRVALAGGRISLDASAVRSGWVFGLGLLLALVPLGWLVTGHSGRLVIGLLGFAIAVGVFYQAQMSRGEIFGRVQAIEIDQVSLRGANYRVATGPGIPVTAAGAALAAICAMWGATVGPNVPRLGLPEKPAGNDQDGSS
jgi:hypothetical protein